MVLRRHTVAARNVYRGVQLGMAGRLLQVARFDISGHGVCRLLSCATWALLGGQRLFLKRVQPGRTEPACWGRRLHVYSWGVPDASLAKLELLRGRDF